MLMPHIKRMQSDAAEPLMRALWGDDCYVPDIVIPPDIPKSEIAQYLDDLCHEWATELHPSVKQLD